jgi:hypothetical protein
MRIGEPLRSFPDREPEQLIDLTAGDEVAAETPCRPVLNDLGSDRNRIGDPAQPTAEICTLSGLLVDLADRGDRFGLTRIDLALG